jgi:hypothetical protein
MANPKGFRAGNAQRKETKSSVARRLMQEQPEATPDNLVALMQTRGYTINKQFIYSLRTTMNRKTGKTKTRQSSKQKQSVTKVTPPILSQLQAASAFIKAVGNVTNALEILKEMKELLDGQARG